MINSNDRRESALQRFEALSQWPMIMLALLYAGLLVLPLFHSLKQPEQHDISIGEYFIWAFFMVEYLVRFTIAPRKIKFIRNNLLDLIIVILPFLRPLRIFRAFVAVRFVVALLRGTKAIRTVFRRKNISYVFLVAAIWVVGSAGLVTLFEKSAPDSNIKSFSDGLWWAFVTVFTVGYGDKYPVTGEGRGLAVALMIVGLALTGVVAGSLASFFIEQKNTAVNPDFAAIAARLSAIERHLGVPTQPSEEEA